MQSCPRCGLPADLDLVEDEQGRNWHRDCFEKYNVTSLATPRDPHTRLEHERDMLLKLVEAKQSHE